MVTALTKFMMPRIPNATIVRAALLTQLANAVECPLTVVAAAPGSGKSALLAEWARGLTDPLAWLSCDVVDADPTWFWRDLCVAIRQAWGGAVLADAELVEANEPRELAIEVANGLTHSGQPGTIVIDDFHLAAPEPAAMLAFIDALPSSVRLVLGGRDDPSFPLGRLRVQGRLLELRQADLRFTTEEIRLVLADLGVELAPVDLSRLEELTEGWAAGVYLAGLSLRDGPEPQGMLRRLVDTDRSLVDFLMNEVIELQPVELRDFLMVTAQLESFDAALCDTVTGRSDSGGMLNRIRAANLFLVGLDRDGAWYRYHHLFGEFLRARLRVVAPGRVPLIHRVAADAYTERGDLVSAVRHSMAAGDTEATLARLATHMATASSLGDQNVIGAAARTWLAEYGAAHLERAPHGILECVRRARTRPAPATLPCSGCSGWKPENPSSTRRAGFSSTAPGVSTSSTRATPLAPWRGPARPKRSLRDHVVDSMWVPSLAMVLVQAQLWLDDLDGAAMTIDALGSNPSQPAVLTEVRRPGYASQAEILRGDLVAAERLAIHAETAADQLELPATAFGRAEPALTMAEVALERNQLDVAQDRVEQLMRIVDHGRRPLVGAGREPALRAVGGRPGRPHRGWGAPRTGPSDPSASHPTGARSHRPRRAPPGPRARRCQPAPKELWRRLPPSPRTELLAARVRLASGDHPGGRQILSSITDLATVRLRIEHGILAALATAPTDLTAAHQFLNEALSLAEPAGYHRTLVAEGPDLWKLLESLPADRRISDYIARLLAAAHRVVPSPRASVPDALIEPLSERELTVLRYLTSRLDGTEIANALYLSVNTVRSHVKAIYRKLGVNSRADAVRQGRSLGLI